MVYGSARLGKPESEKRFIVGLAATDTSIRHFNSTTFAETYPVVQAYQRRAGELAAEGAALVVLPEKLVGIVPGVDSTVFSLLQATSNAYVVTIVAGFNELESPLKKNEAFVFSPGKHPLQYEKKYLLPGFESNSMRGKTPLVFAFQNTIAGVEICKDMDFPEWSREYARRDVKLLFVPAWDFVVDAKVHSGMATMRGIENGFSIVRCAQEGLLSITDWKGNILAEKESFSSPEVSILDSVPPGPGRTFYSTAGDWFAWLNLLATLLFQIPGLGGLLYSKRS